MVGWYEVAFAVVAGLGAYIFGIPWYAHRRARRTHGPVVSGLITIGVSFLAMGALLVVPMFAR